jgi:glyoxylase-like metal-dependent hydrolase (beta-lactamase superfamily II)
LWLSIATEKRKNYNPWQFPARLRNRCNANGNCRERALRVFSELYHFFPEASGVTNFHLVIDSVASFPFDENTYIVHLPQSSDCLVIDPGLEPQKIVEILRRKGLTPAALVCTHGHSDHIGGNSLLKRYWPQAELVIGVGDAPKLTDANLNLSAPFGIEIISPPADRLVRDSDIFEAAGIRLLVREIPGHSSGHVVFIYRDSTPAVVFGGDVLFAGSIGRTDFPDGDFEALKSGIHERLFTLPDDTVVLSGHGPQTTIGREKRTNPFVGVPAGYRG